MTEDLVAFRSGLISAAHEEASIEGSEANADHFAAIVGRLLEEAGIVENLSRLPFDGMIGSARARMSLGALDEDGETLILMSALLCEPDSKLGLPQIREAAERCLRFYTEATRDGLRRAECVAPEVQEFGKQIENTAQQISLVRVIVVTDAEIPAAVLQERQIEGTIIRFEIFDLKRLIRVLGEGASREDIEVDLTNELGAPLPCLKIPSSTGEYDTYLAAVPGELLSRIYAKFGTRLLELNVRAFLGVRGKKTANAGLRDTLLRSPDRFLAFNNGIVATVDDISLCTNENGVAVGSLKGLQIVNGGQTTASLFRAKRKERADISHVMVPTKIIHVKGNATALDEMVRSISRSANTQNTVQPADFSANDPFHWDVERLANNSWSPDGRTRWFYERARGTYGVAEDNAELSAATKRLFKVETPKERRFTKTDLARYVSAWEGRPFEVARGGQKNFQLFMQRLKQSPIEIDEPWFQRLIATAILYRTTERIVRQAGFPAYRALISAYTVALIGQLTGGRMDFGLIWKQQSLSEGFEALVATWAAEVDRLVRETAGNRMPTEWAKKEECWASLCAQMPAPPAALPPELMHQGGRSPEHGSAKPAVPLTSADYLLIQKTMELDAGTLLRISEEGKQSGLLHWKVAAICQTVATYAAGGWNRRPSAKQCRVVIDAVEKVRAAAD
ncbi:AIPR family protein [Sphingomonas kaistensis]|uniref:AIPR family protein n=1 Tax=Sphingomonas kaistensis TaxID=298708 RepID=A0ABZ2FYR9_9SPHN